MTAGLRRAPGAQAIEGNDSSVDGEAARRSFLREAQADPRGTLVALDIDGTVSAIAPSPEQATVDSDMRAVLDRLSQRHHLWFITGRDADKARRIVGVRSAGYVGAHGLEMLNQEGLRPLVSTEDFQSQLAQLARSVAADVPEVAPYVERKRWSVAFHYRAFARSSEVPQQLRRSIDTHLVSNLRLRSGKMVYEVMVAVDHDKGTALGWLIDTIHPRRVLTAGDDLTDVTMFETLAELRAGGAIEGLSVAVLQEAETPAELVRAADVTVDGVAGLHRLLLSVLRGPKP